MGSQVTASKTPLLLECARPFDPDVKLDDRESSEAARYGSALHEVLELPNADVTAIAVKWGPGLEHDELSKHAVRTLSALTKWMSGDNPWKMKYKCVSKEVHRATKLVWVPGGGIEVKTRVCDFEPETHTYDLRPGEFGGTEDILIEAVGSTKAINGRKAPKRIVVDYKSGDWGDFHAPEALPQMLTLALQTDADAVAILHSPRDGVPVMYCDEVSTQDLQDFATTLRRRMKVIGDGTLRPGKWCSKCPARESCPAKDGELLQRAGAMIRSAVGNVDMTTPVDKGQFHMFLQELNRLAVRGKEALKQEVKDGAVISRPDGKVLIIKRKAYETLSKSSIVKALGKNAGGKVIEGLRKKGCITSDEREELWAVDE